MSPDTVDFFVIGAGSGGVRAARIAATHGAKVMIAEDHRIGGTCVLRGCVPKKLYVYASRFVDEFADAAGYGWTLGPRSFDWKALVRSKEAEVTRLSGIYRANLERAGVDIVETRARLEGPHRVVLGDGRRIEAAHILIATGSKPELHPEIPGLEFALTSNEIFDLPELPQKLLIVGAGYIAVEFASIFARLGTEVTLAFRGDKCLRGFDEDMRDALTGALEEVGVTIRAKTLPAAISWNGKAEVTFSDGKVSLYDQVLMATGRRPATRNLGLEECGVALTPGGAVIVDAFSRSTIESIYAVGDVTDRINLTPVAVREGHALADTLFGRRPTSVVQDNVASAVFTTPEIGTVGLTEAQACQQLEVVDVYKASFRPLKAMLSGRTERTIIKLIVDGRTDRVVGVHMFGHEAGEMIQLIAVAMQMSATKADFDATMAVHPTVAEEFVTLRTRTARHVRPPVPMP